MTVEQYLIENRPFFHITASSNMESIRKDGIENRVNSVVGRKLGICVTRSDDPDMWKYIAEKYLSMDGKEFTVILINPHDYTLRPESITADVADLPISNIHNYINRPRLTIFSDSTVFELKLPSPEDSNRIAQKFANYSPDQLEGL